MTERNDIIHYVAGYSKVPNKNGEYLIEVEYEFLILPRLSFLRKVFNINVNDPDESDKDLIYCYDIDEEKAKMLQPYIKEKIDLNKYYFQLECSDKESRESHKRKIEKNDFVFYILANENSEKNFDDEKIDVRKISKKIKFIELNRQIPFSFVKKIFHINNDLTYLIRCYDIEEEHSEILKYYIEEKFNFKKYSYSFDSLSREDFDAFKKRKQEGSAD